MEYQWLCTLVLLEQVVLDDTCRFKFLKIYTGYLYLLEKCNLEELVLKEAPHQLDKYSGPSILRPPMGP